MSVRYSGHVAVAKYERSMAHGFRVPTRNVATAARPLRAIHTFEMRISYNTPRSVGSPDQ